MKEPGLDNRWRDQKPPKSGKIRQKRADTLNENLSAHTGVLSQSNLGKDAKRDRQD